MKKMRCLSLILAMVMLLSSLSIAVSAQQVDTIVLDTLTDINIDEPGEVIDFYFTPAEDGMYVFFSTENTIDTYGHIFLGSEELAKDDDGMEDNNFAVQAFMTAGVQYNLRARAYSNTVTGTAKVQISKMVPPTDMKVETSMTNGTINLGGYLYTEITFSPKNAYKEDVTFVSADERIVKIVDGDVLPAAPGTTTVTVISESGLEDSFEITVLPAYDIALGKEQTFSFFDPVAPTFKFKAPESKAYSFYVKTPEGEVYADLFDGEMEWLNNTEYLGPYSVLHFDATKGETYYFACEVYDMVGQYTVGIKEMTTGTLVAEYDKYIGVVDTYIRPTFLAKPINSYVELYEVELSSSDPEVVSVEGDNLLCHKVGSATITATNKDNISTTFKVTVPEPTRITQPGYYKIETSDQQPVMQYIFIPATDGRYHINTHAFNSYVSVDAEQDDGGAYVLSAGQECVIWVEGSSLTESSFFVLKEGQSPCLIGKHKMSTSLGFAPTTLTPGLIMEVCSECGMSNIEPKEILEVNNPASKQFKDISKEAWYYNGVDFSFNSNLFVGTTENTFSPEQNMSRAMFVTVLGRLSGVTVNNNEATKFTDVPVGIYYTGYVKWANKAGIVNGMTDSTFAPNANITREQICVMMKQYIEVNGLSLRTDFASVKFKDESSIATWAKDAVLACQRGGIINGMQQGKDYYFNPRGTATRAQVATILHNYNKNYTQLLFNSMLIV